MLVAIDMRDVIDDDKRVQRRRGTANDVLFPDRFPSAEAHAMTLLDVVGNDLVEAMDICITNIESAANDRLSVYWFHMFEMLNAAHRTGKGDGN